MTDGMPPAVNGTEQRLDALLQSLDRIEAKLDRVAPVAAPEPQDGDTVELREPAPAKSSKRK